MSRLISGQVGRESQGDGLLGMPLPIVRLADRMPLMILDEMPLPRFYSLFSRSGVRCVAVVTEDGEYSGMISRAGLIANVRACEEGKMDFSGGGEESSKLSHVDDEEDYLKDGLSPWDGPL